MGEVALVLKTIRREAIIVLGTLILVGGVGAGVVLVGNHQIFGQKAAGVMCSGGTCNVTIDYRLTLRKLDPLAVGGVDESGYGAPNVLVNDTLQQQKLKSLHIPYMRMNLKYSVSGDPASTIVCGGSGCDTRWTGDQWVTAIKGTGAAVVVEDSNNPLDLPNLVKHFNITTNNRVMYWLGGINEPNMHGQTGDVYSSNFNQTYDAMKAIDPTIKIGGPTVAWYDPSFFKAFLTGSGSRVDFLDFHGYAQGADSTLSYGQLFAKAVSYENNINSLRNMMQSIIPQRAANIAIQVGEWDLDYAGHVLEYTPFGTVWGASAMGHILRAGGIGLLYADKGNLLLKTGTEIAGASLDDTTPMYHALGMYTGEGLFPTFGTSLVSANTTLANIEVYASDNPKNIVLINQDSSVQQTANVFLNGVSSGSVQIWRNSQANQLTGIPTKIGTLSIVNNSFSYNLPPFSVTTFVVVSSPVTSTSTPVATPTVTATPSNTPNTSACSGEGVYLYIDSNYRGACTKFTGDNPDMSGTAIGNDSASSVMIVGNYQVTLYSKVNYQGNSMAAASNLASLRGTGVGGDTISSLRVQQLSAQSVLQSVSGFEVYNADTSLALDAYNPFANGTSIDLATLPTTHLNFRAIVNPTNVGSVSFVFDGSYVHVENYADYFLEGKSDAYWQATLGAHTITATPYSGAHATGVAGKSTTVTFMVE